MLSAANVTMQFGAKPLFENISVKFGGGNRYGLIGANGCGKSTLMKILGGDLEATGGNVALDPGERLGKLRQDQFAYEDQRVLDVVLMGHAELWATKDERDAIYANPDATEEDYVRAANLEAHYAELGGYTSEARASELLLGLGIALPLHEGPMSAVAPGWKLRVLLAQALFADPEVLLLDEPTNHLDINTIRWLEGVLNARDSTMVIISHDRHFLNSVCTHMADLDYGTLRVYPGDYDDYMIAATTARERVLSSNAKAKDRIAELQEFVRRFSANKARSKQATSRRKQIEKLQPDDVKPSSRQNPYIRFEFDPKLKLHRHAVEVERIAKTWPGLAHPLFNDLSFLLQAGQRLAIVGPNGAGKTTLLRTLLGDLAPDVGTVKWAERASIGYDRRTRPPTSRTTRRSSTGWRAGSSPPTTSRSSVPRWAGFVLGRRDREVGHGALGRRAGTHAFRQADAAAAERAGDGRTHQPHGYGVDRVAATGAGEVRRDADPGVARPPIRIRTGHAGARTRRRTPGALRRPLRGVPRVPRSRLKSRSGVEPSRFCPFLARSVAVRPTALAPRPKTVKNMPLG